MYGIKKISELLGVSPITLRAWENRYGVITPTRTEGGTRIYSEQDLSDLKWILDEKEDKMISIRQAMLAFKEKQASQTSFTSLSSSDINFSNLIDTIYEALIEYDASTATEIVNSAFANFDYETVFHQIFIPILYNVGYQWETGKLSVAQEHFISHFIQRKILRFFEDTQSEQGNVKALAICPPNEFHNIGLLLFSLFLKKRGVDVIYIGENTTKESIKSLIQINQVRLICFSVTLDSHIHYVVDFIEYLEKQPVKLDYLIGGHAANQLPKEYQNHVLTGELEDWEKWFQTTHYHKQEKRRNVKI
ncbi:MULTISPECIES: cobalamin B12-binding domain-containing protein [Paraliobacillus]|uniref:MerR family transcriptional regulator n=1 Tax=Paraliobacillus TaxID=200903 RepID=UPI000DD3790F|nr:MULTISPECIES: cobalamin B12-binding domain-containing protein [Paraliobacillus]